MEPLSRKGAARTQQLGARSLVFTSGIAKMKEGAAGPRLLLVMRMDCLKADPVVVR